MRKVDFMNMLIGISQKMDCKSCPLQCKSKEHSSLANCITHWFDTLKSVCDEEITIDEVHDYIMGLMCQRNN